MSSEAASAAHAGKETIGSFVEIAAKYFAPFAGVIGGFFSGMSLGGAQSVANALYQGGNGKLSGTSSNRVAFAVMALLWLAISTPFWHMYHRGGVWMKALGGFIGGFFTGAGLRQVQGVLSGSSPSSGWLDSLASWGEGVAGGN